MESHFHNTLIRPNIGEFLGSMLFSFMACFAGQAQSSSNLTYPLLSAIALYVSRSLFYHATPAHYNPAVTILKWTQKEISLAIAISFIFVQVIGFLFGVTLFRSLITQGEFNEYIVMYEIVEVDGFRKINRLQAFFMEIALSTIFLSSYNAEKHQSTTIAASWGFIQFVSYPLFGFTSNISLLLVTSTVSYVFSPVTTPSFSLLYLNFFASVFAILVTIILDIVTRQSVPIEDPEESVKSQVY